MLFRSGENLKLLQGFSTSCNSEKNCYDSDMKYYIRKTAFTLAEVLITLGIIGVVAAMTIPSIVEGYRKQETVSRIKKTYSVLNQALLSAENENEKYIYWDPPSILGRDAYWERYWVPYLKHIKICTTAQSCGYSSTSPWVYLDNSRVEVAFGDDDILRQAFYFPDGTFVLIGYDVPFVDDPTNYEQYIWIDINGFKPPNKMGKDFFRFVITTKTGRIDLDGIGASVESINNNCKVGSNGTTCAAKIMIDDWEIKDDYPWQ